MFLKRNKKNINIFWLLKKKFCCLRIFFFLIYFFQKKKRNLSGIPSECQTVWIQIRPDVLSGLIWVQTVCTGYQQMTKIATNGEKLIIYDFFSFIAISEAMLSVI